MAPSPFIVREHTFQGQHIREYPEALANNQEDVLRLHAKSYTPKDVASGEVRGQGTIIGYHGNSFPKEVYEPMMEQLYYVLKTHHDFTIGSIWFADQATQGESALLNDDIMGNDSHWFDHSRDVLQMVNTFRSEMKRPLIGIGHSMGGTQLVATATFHPRLFETVILIDPSLTMTVGETLPFMLKYALTKPETFDSRESMEKYVNKHPFFRAWTPEVKQRYIDTAFHDKPTTLYPRGEGVLKPKTHAFVEARGIGRPNLEHVAITKPANDFQRYTHPDVHTASPYTGPLYNTASRLGYTYLGALRPAAMFLLGRGSKINPQAELEERTNWTGTRSGGSGGVNAGNVKCVTIPGGHALPMTNPQGTADEVAAWIAERVRKLQLAEQKFLQQYNRRDRVQKQSFEPEVSKALKNWDGKLWRNPLAEPDGGKSRL